MIRIVEDDLSSDAIRDLLDEHFAGMLAASPKESCHFLDVEGLKQPGVTFWSIWDGLSLAGMGALRMHDERLGEIKSMRTHQDHLRKGIAAKMLNHIVETARSRGLRRLSLETGSGEAFVAAIRLYENSGFVPCPPFADYREDPFSRYYTLEL